jgi:alpha-L-fucosidase 2
MRTTRRGFLEFVPSAAALAALRPASGAQLPEPGPFTIWYRQPAAKWEEALAVGNGRLVEPEAVEVTFKK